MIALVLTFVIGAVFGALAVILSVVIADDLKERKGE